MKLLVVFVGLTVCSCQATSEVEDGGALDDVSFRTGYEYFLNQNEVKWCKCKENTCKCCVRLEKEHMRAHSKDEACIEVDFEAHQSENNVKVYFNDAVVHTESLSVGNSKPVCLEVPNESITKMCANFDETNLHDGTFHSCLNFHLEEKPESHQTTCFHVQKDSNRYNTQITSFQGCRSELLDI